jgi:multimeric flavodoxin WrbA
MTAVSQNASPPGRSTPERLLAPAERLLHYLEAKDDVLLVTTSNRYEKHTWDVPKTTELALLVQRRLEEANRRVALLDVTKLKIYTCEGNISTSRGNRCGVPDSKLLDAEKNPSGHHRCWASFNNPDDELHVVSRALFAAKVVVFFVSVRWGQTNSVYQRLLERLSWIENRQSTLGEPPIPELENLEAGAVVFGHNWNDEHVLATQRQIYRWFGWKTPDALSFSWQYTRDEAEESKDSYLDAVREFCELSSIGLPRRG